MDIQSIQLCTSTSPFLLNLNTIKGIRGSPRNVLKMKLPFYGLELYILCVLTQGDDEESIQPYKLYNGRGLV